MNNMLSYCEHIIIISLFLCSLFTICLNVKFYIFLGKVIFYLKKVTDIILYKKKVMCKDVFRLKF